MTPVDFDFPSMPMNFMLGATGNRAIDQGW